MDYIENVLGVKVQYQAWQYEAELPYYILDRYEFQQAVIGSVRTVFLYPKTELEQMASVKKQIAKIQKLDSVPVAIILKKISRSRREYMISANIPFVVPGRQLYLPFMGVALQDKFDAEIPRAERLQPSAQLLFFDYLYQKRKRVYISDAGKRLGCSAMTITRAVRQLEQTECFTAEKDGAHKVLSGKYEGYELFDKMRPFLISPVRKKIYVKKTADMRGMCLAGLSALSHMSMVNPPGVMCCAVDSRTADLAGTDVLMDASSQIEIQLWKYNPNILGRDGMVDPLSLAMTLNDNPDERIEEAVDELLGKVWEG